ncbi:Uncharacterized protein ALO71_00924 [Pseudomonas amygdali pv. dendropanacis]|uniref:Uncharacterized protein n=1 Tax=Pseudomonas amygdali pv. dendropanacis TaxID=235272 RepID=A0A0P9PWS2_PSEA0|nr:hypothetical protein [Pseudomonas amygdali]KPX16309.1 Uncharacterized protein ALO71_00924 [Pseudomonas amygdali pv. dendropanacis]KWS74057.1 hypothetical protein AL051_12335 [Pseudomonas amygdali pv. dendropanacis]
MTSFENSIPDTNIDLSADAAANASITSVMTSNGKEVPCRYLDSPNYSHSSNVCLCLHWVHLLYCPTRNSARAYLLRDAIELFLDFRNVHNSVNPEPLQIHNYTDINSEIFIRFIEYVQDVGETLAKPELLKSAIKLVSEETGKLPLLTLPMVPMGVKKAKNEPLSKEGFDTLEYALTKHTNILWDKFAFREEVANAQPYTLEEVLHVVRPLPTKARLLQSFHYHKTNDLSINKNKWVALFLKSPDPAIAELGKDPATALKKFRAIYADNVHKLPANGGDTDPLERVPMSFWEVDDARAVKTFLVNGYPFKIPLDDLYNDYRFLYNVDGASEDVVKTLLHRYTSANRGDGLTLLSVDDLLARYYPSLVDMTALLLFMMFQSGWNKETALSLDKDNFEHMLTGTIEEAVKVVFAEKERSQGLNKPFHSAKRINMPTSSDDPYSFYNLIQLAKFLSAPLAEFPFDQVPGMITEDKMNPLFLCIRPREDWSRGGRLTSIAHPKTFRVYVKWFLAQYEVIDNGKRLTTAKELTRRLRPTWLLYKKKHNPIALLSMSMGHANRDTTDIFYDNSAVAHAQRLQRLRSELEAVMQLLRTRQFKGLLGKHAQAQASEKWKVFHIPGQEKALWACADQTKPDWVGSEIIATTGKKCWAIKECIFCSKLRIFEDSLPYIIERESHISELLESGEGGFTSRYTKELEALQFILDEWGDEDDILGANKYRKRNGPLLPRDLDILEIIFESEDHHA